MDQENEKSQVVPHKTQIQCRTSRENHYLLAISSIRKGLAVEFTEPSSFLSCLISPSNTSIRALRATSTILLEFDNSKILLSLMEVD